MAWTMMLKCDMLKPQSQDGSMSMPKCPSCGKEFNQSRFGQKFCSPLCRARYWHRGEIAKRKGNPQFARVCPECQQEFKTNDKRKKYCTPECNATAQNKRRETTKAQIRKCPVCESLFQPMQVRGVGKTYCSVECRKKSKRSVDIALDRNIYYRNKNRWGGKWLAALERDNFTCQVCGYVHSRKADLDVHHKDGSGEGNGSNHKLDNLITLCGKCHRLFHQVSLVKVNGDYFVSGEIFDILKLDSLPVFRKP